MIDIQEVFVRIEEAKKQQKEIRKMLSDALDNTSGYKEIVDELKQLREKKKQIETVVREGMAGDIMKMEDLKIDIESDQEVLTDIAVTKLMKGESISVNDQYDNEYEPIFVVKFKKAA